MSIAKKMPPLNPRDLAGIDDLLSDEEKAIRATVRTVCETTVDPYVAA